MSRLRSLIPLITAVLIVAPAVGPLAAPASAAPVTPSTSPSVGLAPAAATASTAPSGAAAPTASSTAPVASPKSGSGSGSAPSGPPCTTNAGADHPVVCLPREAPRGGVFPAPPGEETLFVAQVVNDGPAVADASLVLTLPAQLQLSTGRDAVILEAFRDGDRSLTCTRAGGGATVTCRTGALLQGADDLVFIDLSVTDTAMKGRLPVGVALQPVAPDTYPATSVTGSVTVLGTARLIVTLHPDDVTLAVGKKRTITATVHNAGPDASSGTIAVAVVFPRGPLGRHLKPTHFRITNGRGIGSILGGSGGSSGSSGGGQPVSARTAIRAARSSASRNARTAEARRLLDRLQASAPKNRIVLKFFVLHSIAPGKTRTIPLDLAAVSVGKDRLAVSAISQGTANPGCDGPSVTRRTCRAFDVGHLTAVAGDGLIANTGVPHLPGLLGFALVALVLGSGLLGAGRRPVGAGRSPGRARHRH